MKKCVVFLVNFASEIHLKSSAQPMTKPIFHNKKVTALALVSVITVLSFLCSRPSHTKSLSQIDSLLVKNESQQALDSLGNMDRSKFNKRDQAYYNLLLTQAKHDNYIKAPATRASMRLFLTTASQKTQRSIPGRSSAKAL